MSTVDVDRYLSDIERAGVEKGRNQGFVEAVLSVCRTRFGSTPAALTSAVKAASDAAELRRLLDLVTTLSSKEELTSALGAKAGPRAGGASGLGVAGLNRPGRRLGARRG